MEKVKEEVRRLWKRLGEMVMEKVREEVRRLGKNVLKRLFKVKF